MNKLLLALALVFTAACSSSVDGNNDNDNDNDSDQLSGDGDNDNTHDDAVGDTDSDQHDDGVPGDTDACTYAGPTDTACPAPALCATQVLVFEDKGENGWTLFSFGSNDSVQTGTKCSGTKGYKTDVHQFEGLVFNHGPTSFELSDVPANHVSLRAWVSEASAWTVAGIPADPPGSKDGHCYRLPLENCGEGFEGICGSNQHVAPCILHWVSGWNVVELDIPASTGAVAQIMFERQIESGADSSVITIVVDDVRLTTP